MRQDNTSGNMILVELAMQSSIAKATEMFENSVIEPRFRWYKTALIHSSIITALLIPASAVLSLYGSYPGVLVISVLSALVALVVFSTYREWKKFNKIHGELSSCISTIRNGGWRRAEVLLTVDMLRFQLDLDCISDVECALAEGNPDRFIEISMLIYRYVASVRANTKE